LLRRRRRQRRRSLLARQHQIQCSRRVAQKIQTIEFSADLSRFLLFFTAVRGKLFNTHNQMKAFESQSDSQTGRVLTNEAACTHQHPRIRRAKAATRYLLLLAGAVLCYGVATFPGAIAVGQQRVVGDLETWDSIFGSRRAEEVRARGSNAPHLHSLALEPELCATHTLRGRFGV
jgi:hypothetical protein